ncbi:DUF6660 family protein [Flavobacterium selenitireducens]|uniref:DUF6660 family protein n=1 Tax=Flavobacterium selenitireducens TaxID=2722704 RepID=UPI00168B52AC|nr:DUF6660 family protein [Flavobacterium selenitireducens]MBD3581904.1 hypothetical protein [Flavobacterium selenitireducens]
MKCLALILSVLFIALAAKPCADGEATHSRSQTAYSQTHDSHEHEVDLCSPFCSCACCGAYIFNYIPNQAFEVDATVFALPKPTSLYKTRLVSDYFGSIWQPPQLS